MCSSCGMSTPRPRRSGRVQGPQSLFILEKATGESLRDAGFNRRADVAAL
jgi:hypothetical protein